MNKSKSKIMVAVAMSGGVDSSVTAFLLKKQGYQVFGLTMQLVPCSQERTGGCCGLEAAESACRVCQKLGVPHYVINFHQPFKKKVIDYFCREYLAGRTPNPCMACNQYIKFDLLLKKAQLLGADYLATGHYARLRQTKIKNTDKKSKVSYQLLSARDKTKDQSYFLYCLIQKQLKYILFPLGGLTKRQVRQIAEKAKLPTAERPESQEICFVPGNDYRKFLKNNCSSAAKPGQILDKSGKILGQHQGPPFYTIGQRKGLGISSAKPVYVVKIDVKKNILIVGQEKDLYQKECLVKNVTWVSGQPPKLPIKVIVKIRYKQSLVRAEINYSLIRTNMPKKVVVRFQKLQRAITPGQSAVFYLSRGRGATLRGQGENVLGGGIMV